MLNLTCQVLHFALWGLSAAHKVANDGWRGVLKFLRERDAGLAKDQSFVAAFTAWRKEIAKIEREVDGQLEKLAQAEIKAVDERARQQGEKDRRENDPKNIEKENEKKNPKPRTVS